jgi:hypothetical protein
MLSSSLPRGRWRSSTIIGSRKSFGTEVLKGIDLSVNERELVFIIGHQVRARAFQH